MNKRWILSNAFFSAYIVVLYYGILHYLMFDVNTILHSCDSFPWVMAHVFHLCVSEFSLLIFCIFLVIVLSDLGTRVILAL